MGKIIVVTGGARSGKSVFAERYAAAANQTTAYIATAEIYDEEMRVRVDRHQARRPEAWYTFEAPLCAHEAIDKAAQVAEIILFDCLTLYVTNIMLAPETPQTAEERFQQVMQEIDKLLASARQSGKTVIIVTNEVGLGIVPDNALAREFRDLAGMANQKAAAAADEVYLVVSGLAIELKRLALTLPEV
ncbi:MAG: bifunctional adenosylcobinamide kinase/adenosylcobinamide-phosphate guanylyltransferase [Negativicutes bacterium]|nr:bifunctional adenosylcobinamide kinase/adenosylcobinamide-phosphate guanylyltransferase [Negativicutes bacterium]